MSYVFHHCGYREYIDVPFGRGIAQRLAYRVTARKIGVCECPADDGTPVGCLPCLYRAFYKVEREYVEKRAVCISSLVCQDPLSISDGKAPYGIHGEQRGGLLYFREIFCQMFLQIVGAADEVFVGVYVNPVSILLECISGKLPVHIHRQQYHECKGCRQPENVYEGVKPVIPDKIPK